MKFASGLMCNMTPASGGNMTAFDGNSSLTIPLPPDAYHHHYSEGDNIFVSAFTSVVASVMFNVFCFELRDMLLKDGQWRLLITLFIFRFVLLFFFCPVFCFQPCDVKTDETTAYRVGFAVVFFLCLPFTIKDFVVTYRRFEENRKNREEYVSINDIEVTH